jgi:hypothetical protein
MYMVEDIAQAAPGGREEEEQEGDGRAKDGYWRSSDHGISGEMINDQ